MSLPSIDPLSTASRLHVALCSLEANIRAITTGRLAVFLGTAISRKTLALTIIDELVAEADALDDLFEPWTAFADLRASLTARKAEYEASRVLVNTGDTAEIASVLAEARRRVNDPDDARDR